MSLRTRLALLASLLALGGLGLGLGVSSYLLLRMALAEVDHALRLQARVLLESALTQPDRQVPPEVEKEVLGGDFPAAAWLLREGIPVWRGGLPSPPALLGKPASEGPVSLGGWRVYALGKGGYELVVAQPLGVVDRLAVLYLRIGFPLLLAVGILTGILAYLLVGLALAPLRRLTEAAERFQVLEPPSGRDEVARLAQAFSRLLQTLKGERERERSFLALASHELKTPIAAFRVGLERLLQTGVPDLEALRRLRLQAERLEALAENLLALSRAQAQDLRLSAVDLSELAGAVFDRFQPMAVARGREIQLEAEAGVRVLADPRLLERALNNLVQNALVHGRGLIRLRVGREGNTAFVEVWDEGPGLAPTAQEGIGLRVVRQVAQALGARLSWRQEGGLAVRLAFSLDSASPPIADVGAQAPEVRG